ncbi:hypothetical protein GAY29_05390 [Azospirillum brasilense]|nr:hypothetical protein [Azospirillum brasilense]
MRAAFSRTSRTRGFRTAGRPGAAGRAPPPAGVRHRRAGRACRRCHSRSPPFPRAPPRRGSPGRRS